MTTQGSDGRVAVITGVGPGGLGFAVSREFARRGMRLVIVDHPSATELATIAEELSEQTDVIAVSADVSNEADVEGIVTRAHEEFGTIDVLVSNAGVMLRKDVFSTTREEWDWVIGVNLTGTWLMNRAVGRALCEKRSGSIVNIASVYAERVGPLPESAYYASKAGISNLTRALAGEFGPSGVTVNCVAPGVFYPTAMTRPLEDSPEVLARMEARTMLGRLGDPTRDIHGVVAFLVSEDARYITGQTVYADGGWSAW